MVDAPQPDGQARANEELARPATIRRLRAGFPHWPASAADTEGISARSPLVITPATNPVYDPQSRPRPTEDAVVREPHAAGKGCRFHIVGHLTDHNARFLRQRVLDELHDGERTIVIDLAHAQSFDKSALGILVSLTRRVQEAQGSFEFENVPEPVRMSFELLRLDHVFVMRASQRNVSGRTPPSSSVIPLNPRPGTK